MSNWRSTDYDLPGWTDSGKAEFLRKDGTMVSGYLSIDTNFDGEDEYPLPEVFVPDLMGMRQDSFFDFAYWRLVK